MSSEKIFTNARLVTDDAVRRGTLAIDGDRIVEIGDGASHVPGALDLEGDFLIPGLVELHTDNLERHFTPRPGVRWPSMPAAVAHDAQIISSGITTVFDAVAIGDHKQGSRLHDLSAMTNAVIEGRKRGLFRADHLMHLRCEVSFDSMIELFKPFQDIEIVGLASLMDHTPGQRQFVDMDKFREYYQGKHGLSDTEIDALVARQRHAHVEFAPRNRAHVVAACRARGIAIASHDDATEAHVVDAVEDSVSVAEFPTTHVAAKASRAAGMKVLMGAPNLVRGGSHSGNVSARDLAAAGLLDILSSDYVPISLLHAAFMLPEVVAGVDLPRAVAMVAANPAEAAGLDDRGRLAAGRRADLVQVRLDEDGTPMVRGVWSEGERVY